MPAHRPFYCPGPLCNGTTNGRSPIIVTAIGEESFKDANGSGVFNPADTVAWNASDGDNNFTSGAQSGQPKPWQDTSEPFLNEWELFDSFGTPTFVAGEPFIDFNNNGQRDGPNGLVESALCQGPLCDTTSSSVAIYAGNIIILSGSTANFAPAPGATFHVGGGTSLTFQIADDRNQQMPSGTTVAATVASAAGTIAGPASYKWPCAAAVGGAAFTFNITPPTTAGSGSLILTVTTPGGIVTTAFYNLVP